MTVRSEVVDLSLRQSPESGARAVSIAWLVEVVDRVVQHLVLSHLDLIKKSTRAVRDREVVEVDDYEGKFEVLHHVPQILVRHREISLHCAPELLDVFHWHRTSPRRQ